MTTQASTNDAYAYSRTARWGRYSLAALWLLCPAAVVFGGEPAFEDGAKGILQAKCGACHGEDRVKRKAELDLRSASSIFRGGESGTAVVPGKVDESLLWQMVDSGSMPPEGSPPLVDSERETIKAWIAGGAKTSDAAKGDDGPSQKEKDFWSFRPLSRPEPPHLKNGKDLPLLDQFVVAELNKKDLNLAPEADRRTLVRRVYLDLIGLPPSPQQVDAFLSNQRPDAYERLVDQLLAAPQFGERWGRQWLDVAGYSDSNGYIRHDSPRPLAYRYRDYVIQSLNEDKPYDQFWREQLAGDELVNYPAAQELSRDDLNALIATHYLRNAPDGTDNTEGSEITRVMERYAVLESQLQITMSAMFGVTIECARCHSHKFDPIPHRDYYALQSIFYPAFNVKDWVQPKDRWIYAAGQNKMAAWRASQDADKLAAKHRKEFVAWLLENRPEGTVEWQDDFEGGSLASNWCNTAPDDNVTAGDPPVQIDGNDAPAARGKDGHLALLAPATGDSTWLVTKQSIDWTPNRIGDWVQVTFDFVGSMGANGQPAERLGYYIALYDYDDTSRKGAGNILFDGMPAGGAEVYIDYPGADQKVLGVIGKSGYQHGRNYGVRVTRIERENFLLEQVVDGKPEGQTLQLPGWKLVDGGFGFELSCGRSLVIDNVVVKKSTTSPPVALEVDEQWNSSVAAKEPQTQGGGNSAEAKTTKSGKPADVSPVYSEAAKQKYRLLRESITAADRQKITEPDKLAWATDLTENPPEVPILKRGDYFQHGPTVAPGTLSVLVDEDNALAIEPPASGAKTTGRRLAFARWATKPGSRAAALLARVEADRLWRGHLGRGLVPTPENFGASGERPTHPALLEWLASELVDSGWRMKSIHRQIVLSRTYRQASAADEISVERDPENLLYSRFPAHRIDAESIRDSMLAVAGVINLKQFGPGIEYVDRGNRQIALPEPTGERPYEVDRRSIYIRHRRTEPVSFLQAFDQGLPEPNCIARPTSTVVAQSLAMVNGEFAMRMGKEFADRLKREAGDKSDQQILLAFQISLARDPSAEELSQSQAFIEKQASLRAGQSGQASAQLALADFCRMLLATSEFVYMQ